MPEPRPGPMTGSQCLPSSCHGRAYFGGWSDQPVIRWRAWWRGTHDEGERGHGGPSPELVEALREFIRTEGSTYLQDPNVTSIGVGYKVRDGKRTNELSIQFTVDTKAKPEALSALDTEPLPKTIEIAGVAVPTDVLERSYQPSFKIVPEATPSDRKVRIDPVRPGVSVGHPSITAGTIGAIVYDTDTGQPCVLSNWHVLHANNGTIGDVVVQPGPHDDNRIDQNQLGPLLRSHLGLAGDGAIAAVEGRELDPRVLDLDTAPVELGEPELGDKVIKCGRTTGVTHGIVRRVDTLVKLDYGLEEGDVNDRLLRDRHRSRASPRRRRGQPRR